ncbi:hypothetical protein BS35_002802 [Actinomadura glauciflava]|nr:hypothetical protein [Actinomadura glauciflava]
MVVIEEGGAPPRASGQGPPWPGQGLSAVPVNGPERWGSLLRMTSNGRWNRRVAPGQPRLATSTVAPTHTSTSDPPANGSDIPDTEIVAWEWVSPVATSVGGFGIGLAGIVATYKAGNRQQETALAVAKQQADNQLAVAREERQQRRLETAYTDLLVMLSHVNEWLLRVYPMMTATKEEFTMPSMPEIPNRIEAEAALTAYWSPAIRRLMDDWREAVLKVQRAGIEIAAGRESEERGRGTDIDYWELLRDLPDQKEYVRIADERIREQVRLELIAQSDGNLIQQEENPPEGAA